MADVLGCHDDVVRSPGKFWEYVPFRFQDDLQKYVDKIANSKHAFEFNAKAFLPYIGDAWLRFLAAEVPMGKVAIFKEPSVDGLENMLEMYPKSRAILMVRDGRDIVSSQLKADFSLPSFQKWNRHHWRRLFPDEEFRLHCREFRLALDTLNQFLESQYAERNKDRFLLVKYEDLVRTPRQKILEIGKWGNLSPAQFDWERFQSMPVRGSSFLRNRDGQHDFGVGVKKPEEGFQPLGRWREWPKKRLRYYEKIVGDAAYSLGYSDDENLGVK